MRTKIKVISILVGPRNFHPPLLYMNVTVHRFQTSSVPLLYLFIYRSVLKLFVSEMVTSLPPVFKIFKRIADKQALLTASFLEADTHYYHTHSLYHEQDVTQDQFYMWSTAGLNSEFSFSSAWLTKAKKSNLPQNFPMIGEN